MSAGGTTLTDLTANFTGNQWAGESVRLLGEVRTAIVNTSTTITVDSPWNASNAIPGGAYYQVVEWNSDTKTEGTGGGRGGFGGNGVVQFHVADPFGGGLSPASSLTVEQDGVLRSGAAIPAARVLEPLADGALSGLVGYGSGAVHVVSGSSGTLIATVTGTDSAERLGVAVANEDIDGDGAQDWIVGRRGGGLLLNGTTGLLLWMITTESATPAFAVLGDMDADGALDILVGDAWAHGNVPRTGGLRLVSPFSGDELWSYAGAEAWGAMGSSVAAVSDIDGDAAPDWAAGAPQADGGGEDKGAAVLFGSGIPDPGTVSPFGSSCGSLVPAWSGAPILGQDLAVSVTGALPAVPVFLLVGSSNLAWSGVPLPIELSPFGAPGCFILVPPEVLLATTSNLLGSASWSFTLPTDPLMHATSAHIQWFAVNWFLNPLMLDFSSGLTITLSL